MSYDPFDALVRGVPTGYGGVLCLGAVSPGLVRYLSDNVGARVHVCDFDEQRLQLLQSEMQENSVVQYHNVLPLFEAGDLPEIGYHCSEPTHSSLALPSGITEILPGLIFEPVEVEGLAFTDLFEEGNFSTSEANLLIVATNGYEASWLAKESALAALFSTVLIRSPRSNCFETVDTQGLAGDLAQSGLPAISLPMRRPPYEAIVIHQSPDWHAQRSELDALRSESEALQSKLSTLIEDGHAISERLAAVTSEAESEKAELNQRVSSLESDNGALIETLQERDAVANELRSALEGLQAQLSVKAEEAQAMSESLNAARSEAESEKAELNQRVSSLESDLDALTETLQERDVLANELGSAHEELQAQLSAKEEEAQAMSESLDAARSEAESEKAELNQRVSSLESDLDALTETLQERDVLANELGSAHEELQAQLSAKEEEAQAMSESLDAARSEAEYEKAELNQRVSSLESDLDALTETLQERDALANEYRSERDELAAEVERQTKWHEENKNWAASLNEQVVKLDADRETQLQSTLLAQKMLARTQGDLEHLRDQYKAKVASEQKLVQLIGELKQKLIVASNYYFRLQEEHPELLDVSEHNHLSG